MIFGGNLNEGSTSILRMQLLPPENGSLMQYQLRFPEKLLRRRSTKIFGDLSAATGLTIEKSLHQTGRIISLRL